MDRKTRKRDIGRKVRTRRLVGMESSAPVDTLARGLAWIGERLVRGRQQVRIS